MKTILTLVAVLFCLSLSAQEKVIVSGQIIRPSQEIYLRTETSFKSLKLSPDGRFTDTIVVSQFPSKVSLRTLSDRGRMNPLTPEVWIADNRLNLTVDLSRKPYAWRTDKVHQFQAVSEQIEKATPADRPTVMLRHLDKLPTLMLLDEYKLDMAPDDLQRLYAGLSPNLKESVYARRVGAYVEAKKLKQPGVGDKIQNFRLHTSATATDDLLRPNQKRKIIALMVSGCPHSMASIDVLARLQQKLPAHTEIITIWSDEEYTTWQNYGADLKKAITWTDLWDPYRFAANYLADGLTPMFFVVTDDGTVIDRFDSFTKESEKKLLALGQ